jgi:hypothetical protein
MNHAQRETATHPAFANRETRDENPYFRIIFNGGASPRYRVLRRIFIGGTARLVPYGDYTDLETACAMRDALPINLSDGDPTIQPPQPTRRLEWWEE